jgi:hypothetical protein
VHAHAGPCVGPCASRTREAHEIFFFFETEAHRIETGEEEAHWVDMYMARGKIVISICGSHMLDGWNR